MVLESIDQINIKNLVLENKLNKPREPFIPGKDIPGYPMLTSDDWVNIHTTIEQNMGYDSNNDQDYMARRLGRLFSAIALVEPSIRDQFKLEERDIRKLLYSRKRTVVARQDTSSDLLYLLEFLGVDELKKHSNYMPNKHLLTPLFFRHVNNHEYENATRTALRYKMAFPTGDTSDSDMRKFKKSRDILIKFGRDNDDGWFSSYLKILFPDSNIEGFEVGGQLDIRLQEKMREAYTKKDWQTFFEDAKILSIMHADDIDVDETGIHLLKKGLEDTNMPDLPSRRRF